MTNCEELDFLIYENFNSEQVRNIRIAMESPGIAHDTLKNFFDKITSGFKIALDAVVGRREKPKDYILESKGDITSIKKIETSLKILDILNKSKDNVVKKAVSDIRQLYDGIKAYRSHFRIAFNLRKKSIGALFVWAVYVTDVLLLVESISDTLNYHVWNMNKAYKSKDRILGFSITNVSKEAENYRNGVVKKWINFFLPTGDKKITLKEDAGIIVGALLIASLITFAFFLRVLVFYFYFCRAELADYFEHQASYLNIHESEIKKEGKLDRAHQDSVIQAQKVWANRFMDLSNFIQVDSVEAARKANNRVKEANKEVNPATVNVINPQNTGMDFF